MPDGILPADVSDCRYLSLVRELAAVTQADCDPVCNLHRRNAAQHINAFLSDPWLLWKLVKVAENLQAAALQLSPESSAESSDSSSAG